MACKWMLSAALLLLSCRAGWAAEPGAAAAAMNLVPAQRNQVAPGPALALRRGLLYRVRHLGKTSYLFGTVHAGKQGLFPLAPEVTQALAEANKLVIELDIRETGPFQEALDKHGVYPTGDNIRNHVSAAAFARLREALLRAGLQLSLLDHYKPWLLANLLVGRQLEQQGFQRSQGVEFYLLDLAQQQAKKVMELESADYQLSLFDAMDDRQQERYLLENLADLDDGTALRRSAALIDAWSAADPGRMTAMLGELTGGGGVSAGFMQHTLLGKRNPEMASSIEAIMRDDQVAFVGVGLLHLIGSNGVPQLLRQRGYEVEQVF